MGYDSKTGGEGFIRPTPRTGGGAPQFPGTSSLFHFATVLRQRPIWPSEDGPRCDMSKLTEAMFGGDETKPGLCGGWEGGLW